MYLNKNEKAIVAGLLGGFVCILTVAFIIGAHDKAHINPEQAILQELKHCMQAAKDHMAIPGSEYPKSVLNIERANTCSINFVEQMKVVNEGKKYDATNKGANE